MKVLAVLLLAVGCALANPIQTSRCKGGYECPSYKVIEKYAGYELREYEPTVWVNNKMTQMESDFWEDRSANNGMFMSLFRYISGANDRSQKMDMTVPVLNSHFKDKVYMGFMIPAEFSSNVPTPTNPDLDIYRAPKGRFYVSTFGGYAYGFWNNKNYFKTNLADLLTKIEGAQQSIDETMFFTASYDSPWKFWGRTNEVWVPAA